MEVPINITSELTETIDSVKKALSDACQLALKQTIPGKQLVLMTDTSFRSPGLALMIGDNPHQKIQPKLKTYTPVAFGSKVFSPAQLKVSTYSKKFLASFITIPEFAHILWKATKPTIVLTDNKSVTGFFSNERNSTSTVECIWLFVATLLQKSRYFRFGQHCGCVSLQTGNQSHGEHTSQNLEDIQTTLIEVTTTSTDVADEDKIFLTQSDYENESEQQPIERKNLSRLNAEQWTANMKPPSLKASVKEITKRSTETLRRNPWKELRQMQAYE